MPELVWQKSSYSAEAANCLYVAATSADRIHLRESDAPDTVLITTRPRLHALIRTLKAHPFQRSAK
ncbi:DUF397 domain-containing protein [Streptomyces sp. MMBL 11-3]|uniref:DUF397 domain-containing protein n=1 Tax=Streptomyces sp. MMBL 11-3 TaxID=3382639 RepID=UPI0039B4FD54